MFTTQCLCIFDVLNTDARRPFINLQSLPAPCWNGGKEKIQGENTSNYQITFKRWGRADNIIGR